MVQKIAFFILFLVLFFGFYIVYKHWMYTPKEVKTSITIYAEVKHIHSNLIYTSLLRKWMPQLKSIGRVSNQADTPYDSAYKETIVIEGRPYEFNVKIVSNIVGKLITQQRVISNALHAYKTYRLDAIKAEQTLVSVEQTTVYAHPVARSSADMLDQLTLNSIKKELSALKKYSEEHFLKTPTLSNAYGNQSDSKDIENSLNAK